MDKLIVNNKRRIKKCLGFDVNSKEDLLKNENAKEFIAKYENIFNSNDAKDFKKLMDETGIIIAHFYITRKRRGKIESVYFNMMGSSVNNPLSTNKSVFNQDIIVVTYVDDILVKDNIIFVDNKKIYDCKDDIFSLEKGNRVRYDFNFISESEKIEYINKNYCYNYINKNVKQVTLDIFENVTVLYKNGELYRNNTLYDTDVEYLYHMDSYNSYIIYKDNSIYQYTSEFPDFSEEICKKVIYKDYAFLAKLHENCCVLDIADSNIPDTNILMSLYDVDDINYYYDKECAVGFLELIKNGEKFKFPLTYNPIVVTDIAWQENSVKRCEHIIL